MAMLYTQYIPKPVVEYDECPKCGENDWWSTDPGSVQCRACGWVVRVWAVGREADEVSE